MAADKGAMTAHGGFNAAYFEALGCAYRPSLDFSVNVNPWGASEGVDAAVRAVDYGAYPDPGNWGLRVALGARLDWPAAGVVVDAGSCRILWSLVRTFVAPGAPALVVEPTFGAFHRAVAAVDGQLHAYWRGDGPGGWSLEPETLSARIEELGARCVYICNPNNPTGEWLPAGVVARLARRSPDCVFILDEAYRYVTRTPELSNETLPDNVVRLQSLTKEQGIPGLRMGYGRMHPALAQRVEVQRPAWCCGQAESAAMVAAVDARDGLPAVMERWFEARDGMVRAARHRGFRVQVADAPWFLIRDVRAAELRDRAVIEEGMLMRDCASFGIGNALRVCPRLPEANARWIHWIGGISVAAVRVV